ncbi:hypothetical protein, partial [Paenibacillus sp. IITD108]|uniref:hypothetical protein n=1 Tax=Paenibacillus sp. IITD108 TaxID=3116649 RepID=UPI002F3EB049
VIAPIDLKRSAREAVHYVTNLQDAISHKMCLLKFLRIVEALSVNKCSFRQRFTANKHATIRYIFKTSFFGVITLPGRLSIHCGQLLISNEKGETESKNGNGEAVASAFVG